MVGYFSAMAQVLMAIGLTYCSMIASGQTCSMSSQIAPQMRHGAQAAHDAADAERVGDGLAQVVLLGHLEIDDRSQGS